MLECAKNLLFRFCKVVARLAYKPLCLLPTRPNRIVFLSKRSNSLPLDFALIQNEINRRDINVEIVSICCCMIGSKPASKMNIWLSLIKSMVYLSTSRVCILDSYWPMVSILDHKDSLIVIQMWHSLGKIKQSGLITAGKPGGRSASVSQILNMHANYDYIVAGAKAWNPYYCDSFGCSIEQILNFGLPRMDYLLLSKESNSMMVANRYPEVNEKIVLLYAPTFRRNGIVCVKDLADLIDSDRFMLIVKSHPEQELDAAGVQTCSEFSAQELLSIADFLITDYSAIALEAAVIDVKTLYYVFDYDVYARTNGLNIDLFEEMPGCVFSDADELVRSLSRFADGHYPNEVFERYKEKYLVPTCGQATSDLVDFVSSFLLGEDL